MPSLFVDCSRNPLRVRFDIGHIPHGARNKLECEIRAGGGRVTDDEEFDVLVVDPSFPYALRNLVESLPNGQRPPVVLAFWVTLCCLKGTLVWLNDPHWENVHVSYELLPSSRAPMGVSLYRAFLAGGYAVLTRSSTNLKTGVLTLMAQDISDSVDASISRLCDSPKPDTARAASAILPANKAMNGTATSAEPEPRVASNSMALFATNSTPAPASPPHAAPSTTTTTYLRASSSDMPTKHGGSGLVLTLAGRSRTPVERLSPTQKPEPTGLQSNGVNSESNGAHTPLGTQVESSGSELIGAVDQSRDRSEALTPPVEYEPSTESQQRDELASTTDVSPIDPAPLELAPLALAPPVKHLDSTPSPGSEGSLDPNGANTRPEPNFTNEPPNPSVDNSTPPTQSAPSVPLVSTLPSNDTLTPFRIQPTPSISTNQIAPLRSPVAPNTVGIHLSEGSAPSSENKHSSVTRLSSSPLKVRIRIPPSMDSQKSFGSRPDGLTTSSPPVSNSSGTTSAQPPSLPEVKSDSLGSERQRKRDEEYLVRYTKWRLAQNPDLLPDQIVVEVMRQLPHRTMPDWQDLLNRLELNDFASHNPNLSQQLHLKAQTIDTPLNPKVQVPHAVQSTPVDQDISIVPTAPSTLIPRPDPPSHPELANSRRWTDDEDQFLIDYMNWYFSHTPDASTDAILREIAHLIPRHNFPSWSNRFREKEGMVYALEVPELFRRMTNKPRGVNRTHTQATTDAQGFGAGKSRQRTQVSYNESSDEGEGQQTKRRRSERRSGRQGAKKPRITM